MIFWDIHRQGVMEYEGMRWERLPRGTEVGL
jgi:hypothetical protein